jgi:pimeloyl-ACP methyl ester carboxylesterase
MVSRRAVLTAGVVGAGSLVAGGIWAGASFTAALQAAKNRVSSGSDTIDTNFGRLEYAEAGSGRPVLMIHGTGGGFDQGLSFCRPLIGPQHRIIAPSRFGYLRSDFPEDPSSERQADALVELLDHLGIDRIPVAGGSAGALSAISFALRHPDRCSALIAIVPATYVPGRAVTPGPTGLAEDAMTMMLRSDFLYWLAMSAVPDQIIGTMLATDPALLGEASSAERSRVYSIMRDIMPISRRTRGLVNDARLASNPAPMNLASITVPTLSISVEDDRFGTCEAARHIASEVQGARLVTYPTGGHVWVGHNDELFGEIASFLRDIS